MTTSPRPLDGIVCLGHSNVQMSYMIALVGGTEPGGTGAANLPQNRWTYMLQQNLGGTVRIINYGWNGRKIDDFMQGGFHMLLQGAGQRGWMNERGKIVVTMLGLNDDDYPLPLMQERYTRLIHEIQATGAHPVVCTELKVDFDGGHYDIDRNLVLEPLSAAIAETALSMGATVCDIYARTALEISLGNWDQRIRANGTTFDNSQDGAPPPPWNALPPADWFTNAHFNVNGATIVADELATVISGLGIL